MKTFVFRLPNVEAEMLQYLKSRNKEFRDFDGWLRSQIREAYAATLRK